MQRTITATTLVKSKDVVGVEVKNLEDENLGTIDEIVLDKLSGRVVYVVLKSGSFLGLGGKLFALPWIAIKYDKRKECFLLDINKNELKSAPGFDKDNWPNLSDRMWARTITEYYNERSYWE